MKIGILTFHCAINYGAVLQAYGLQEVLKSMGHDVYIIDYRPEYLKSPYRLFFPEAVKGHGFLGNIRFFVRELLALPIRYKRRCAFNGFIKKHLHLANLDFQSEDNDFDCFVFGSDQIWNPQITEGDPVFFGDAPCFNGKKMFVYAASAGSVDALKEIDKVQLKTWLSKFSALSVREKSLSHYLSEELQLENQLVIDPVLLAGKDVFHQITSSKKIYKPYLLFFSLLWDDDALRIAKQYAQLHELDIIEMYSIKVSIRNNSVLHSLSPIEFVEYFQNATFIVTNSFHGTVFSAVFHKPFICVASNFGKSRFYSLLDMLGLQDRLVDVSNQIDFRHIEIDWNSVDEILYDKRNDSISFLEECLSYNKVALIDNKIQCQN